jgi:hypothetical protein
MSNLNANFGRESTVNFVRSHVQELLKGGGGVIDSYSISKIESYRRFMLGLNVDDNQIKDYVQFCLREMPNVCRHCIGQGRYVVHIETECSDNCKEKYSYWGKWLGQEPNRCPSCYLELPLNGECGLCS